MSFQPTPAASETITINKAKVGAYVATLPLDAIKVGARFRQDHGDLDALARSIRELGLLQPIGVDREHRLIFGHRRFLAHQRLGLETIQARVVEVPSLIQAEHDENELRKAFTPSERVAIAEAIKAEIGSRQGQRTDRAEPLQNFAEVAPGQTTREAVAKAAGFGNAETYRQAKTVVDKADPALVQAMDAGEIAISTAARLASAPTEIQQRAAAEPKAAPKLARRIMGWTPDRGVIYFGDDFTVVESSPPPASARDQAHTGTEVVEMVWQKPLHELDGDVLRKEAHRRLESIAAMAERECSDLASYVEAIREGDLWLKLADDWDTFCLQYFGRPAGFVDCVVAGVKALEVRP